MKRAFFISTAIDYPSTDPHLGHAYEKICADVIARFKRLQGFEVHFSTGTDEHGLKIQRYAERAGERPREFVDRMSNKFKKFCDELHISYDDFIRTTEERHIKTVQTIFNKLYQVGDIYKGVYEGLYCTECETFYSKEELIDGKCPIHKKEPERVEEECYFFRMSKYRDEILKFIKNNQNFIRPESRRNEILNRLKGPLKDLCISRTSFSWGIPLPMDKRHVLYVWVDALSNYLSTIGYPDGEFKKFWPADVQFIGKDIAWHHCVIWSSLLFSLGLQLSKKIFVHGFLTVNGQKISKSLGNVIDPVYLAEKYSSDAVRYFLIRDIPLGEDGDFSEGVLITRLNDELADILGNLVHRVLTFIYSKFNGEVPKSGELNQQDQEVINLIENTPSSVGKHIEELNLGAGLREIIKLAKFGNKYFNDSEPWRTIKDDPERCATTLYVCAQLMRSLAIMLIPYLPSTSEKIWKSLNLSGSVHERKWESAAELGLKHGHKIEKPEPLFEKMPDKAIAKNGEKSQKNQTLNTVKGGDFEKLDIRIGKIENVEQIPKSKKLLKLSVDLGGERRTIVAGLAEHYSAEELVGKHVAVVLNMEPVQLMGVKSEGMLLAAEDGKIVSILTIEKSVKPGAKVR